jgi:hypothetical protein
MGEETTGQTYSPDEAREKVSPPVELGKSLLSRRS